MTLPNVPPAGGGLPKLPPSNQPASGRGQSLPLPPQARLPQAPPPQRQPPSRPVPQAIAPKPVAPQLPVAPQRRVAPPTAPAPAPRRPVAALPSTPTPPTPAPAPAPAPAPVPVPPVSREPEPYLEPDVPVIDEQEERRAKLEHERQVAMMEGSKSTKGLDPSVKKVLVAEDQKIKAVKFIVYALVILLVIVSLKSLFFTQKLPTPHDMAIDITRAMNKTTFPAERAEGFVQEFILHYLTTTEKSSDRDDKLATYMSSEALQSVNKLSFPHGYVQKVTDGPYIHGVRYVSEETAVFTIGVQLNGSSWEYYAVNVYYDRESRGFAIPKPPTVVPQPIMGKSPIEAQLVNVNEEASTSARTVVDSYFAAWVSGAATELDVALSAEASNNARHSGFAAAGIKFSRVVSLSVLGQSGDFKDTNLYMGVAVVEMNKPVEIDSEQEDRSVSYVAEYNLILEYSGKGNKWLIKDIQPREYIPSGVSANE